MAASTAQRIICLIDMDCFYVQCEQRLEPDKWGKPCAVAQYNNWKGGGIIAVNYEARAFGVKRGMRGDDATKLCPELHLFAVPEKNGKADLTRYRNASAEVFDAIAKLISSLEEELKASDLIILERASVDEAFLDFTKYIDTKALVLPDEEDLDVFNTKLVMGDMTLKDWIRQMEESGSFNEHHLRLIMGSILAGKMRQLIYDRTQFKCSAGISFNKMLAKLACGTHKPNAQTILPREGVHLYFQSVNISDVRSLGGKLGREVKQVFAIETMDQLKQMDHSLLMQHFGSKTAQWLIALSNGLDDEPVTNRRLSKSIGCGKNFRGKLSLTNLSDIHHWIKVLCEEIHLRMENDKLAHKRLAKQIVVGYYTSNKGQCSKSISLNISDGIYPTTEKIVNDIMKTVFFNFTHNFDPVLNLSIVATKFTEKSFSNRTSKIDIFFKKVDRTEIGKEIFDNREVHEETDDILQMDCPGPYGKEEEEGEKDQNEEGDEEDEEGDEEQDLEGDEEEQDEDEQDEDEQDVGYEEEQDEEGDDEEYNYSESEDEDEDDIEDIDVDHMRFVHGMVQRNDLGPKGKFFELPPEKIESIKKSFFFLQIRKMYHLDQDSEMEFDFDGEIEANDANEEEEDSAQDEETDSEQEDSSMDEQDQSNACIVLFQSEKEQNPNSTFQSLK